MTFNSIHVAANDVILLFLMAEYYSIVQIWHILFIHSFADGHLRFRLLDIVSSAAVNMQVQMSFWYIDFFFFG